MDEEAKKYFLDGIDEENVTQEIWKGINIMFSKLSHLINYKYHLIIYRLVKKKYVKMSDLEDATGYSRQRIHQIISGFERREVERIHQNEENN